MSKRARDLVFGLLVILFFILGGGVVLYAQGWRMAFNPFAVGKVGAIYVRSFPDDATITLDGKTQKKPLGFFERGVLMNDLFPEIYQVKVAKRDYYDWSSSLLVEPSRVTSRSRVVLVPKTAVAATSTPASDFALFGNTLSLVAGTGTIIRGTTVLPGDTILAGAADGKRLITFASKDNAYYWNDLDAATSTLFSRLFPAFRTSPKITPVFTMVPGNESLFLISASSSLSLANAETGQITVLEGGAAISALGASETRIAWAVFDPAHENSLLSLYDLLSETFRRQADLAPGEARRIEFLDQNDLLLLQSDGQLYSLSLTDSSRLKIADGARDISLARNNTRLAVLEDNAIEVLPQNGDKSYFYFRIPDAKSVRSVIWYKDNDHLFLAYEDKAVFMGMEDPLMKNLAGISGTGRFAYAPEDNVLYTLRSGTLSKFTFPE